MILGIGALIAPISTILLRRQKQAKLMQMEKCKSFTGIKRFRYFGMIRFRVGIESNLGTGC